MLYLTARLTQEAHGLRRLRPLQSGLATHHRPLLKGTSPARQQYNYRLSPEVIRLGIVSDLAVGFRLLLDL
jgi:hypothetical protein